jgi:hypothetical protein
MILVLVLAVPVTLHAAEKRVAKPASASPTAPVPAAAPAPAASTSSAPAAAVRSMGGLPGWKAPSSYSVEMVATHDGQTVSLKRYIDGSRIRSDIRAEGQAMSMIEMGDEAGTSYTVIDEQKRAIKQSAAAMKSAVADLGKQTEAEPETPAAPVKVEYLGKEKMNGKDCDKYRYDSGEKPAFAWIDPATQFPVRMQYESSTVDWKNYSTGPQPAQLFEVPKGYEVVDMDEMMKKMGAMGGMQGMGGAMGGRGMPGMGGGVSGMANNMAGSFGNQMGSQMGTGLGSSLGASFGGPLGAMAGGYLGGRIGGMIGEKAARAVTPGK